MSTRFGLEYIAHRETLEKEALGGVCMKIPGLKKVLGPDGPDRAHGQALDDLRDVGLQLKEIDRIMEAAGLDPNGTGIPADAGVRKAALVKFLRHLYLVGARGNHQVWVLSTPASYRQFPSGEIMDANLSHQMLRTKLGDTAEQFDLGVRRKMGEASQLALSWVEAAKLTLSLAQTDPKQMARVRRWFADGATTEARLDMTIAQLQAGFKKMANSLNDAIIVITDLPRQRLDPKKQYTEAFIKKIGGLVEMPRTIYIEQAFFRNIDVSVLHDVKRNWARVLVHECSHIDGETTDHRYAYRGIKVGSNLSDAEAAANADSWAFFAADCAGALVPGEVLRARGGTGGTLDELPLNWH
jgi:hypothetical protein